MMEFLPYLVAVQMPVMMITGVYLLSVLFNKIDDRHPQWAVNAAGFILVSLIFLFTLPALQLALNIIKQ